MLAGFRRFVLLVVLITVASGCWSQYRGDWSHSGNQPLEFAVGTGTVSKLAEVWSAATGGAIDTAPTVTGGVAYVGAADGKLYAFDAAGNTGCSGVPKTCAPLWTGVVQAGVAIRTTPAVAGGVVYVQGQSALVAFATDDLSRCSGGTSKTCPTLWTSGPLGDVRSSPTVAYGRVFTTGTTGLKAFDQAAGADRCAGLPKVCSPVWASTAFTPGNDASPTIADGKVFVAGATGLNVYDGSGVTGCLGTPTTCAPLWRTVGAASSPAVVAGTVYLPGGEHGLAAYDAAGVKGCAGNPLVCTPLWSATLSVATGETVDPPAVANGVAYLTLHGSVYAFDVTGYLDGSHGCLKASKLCTPLWQTAPGSSLTDVATGAPMIANGVVYAGGHDRLAAYDASGTVNCAAFPKTCDPLWTTGVSAAGYGPPVLMGGTVYAGSGASLRVLQLSERAPAPTVSGLSATPTVGQTTPVTALGTGFVAGLTVGTTIPGAVLGTPTGVTGSAFTVSVNVPTSTPAGAYKLTVRNPDQGLATMTVNVIGGTSGPEVALRSGISGFPGIMWAPTAERDADIKAIADAGAKWIELDLDWKSIQANATDFGWSRGSADGNGGFDGAVKAARARGLNVLASIVYSPKWASASCADQGGTYVGHCLPDASHVTAFADFAAAAVARYGSLSTLTDPLLKGSITNWQIWNEPNHQEFSLPRPDPDRFAAMLKAAYPKIKLADPSATVITGGTAPSANEFDAGGQTEYAPTTWLLGLYDRGAGDSFDAVGHHPYSFPWNPLDDADYNGFTQARYLYLEMAAHGDASKKVWGTEMGAATGTVPLADPNQPCLIRSMTETEQAQWVHDYYLGWNTNFRSFTGPLILKAIRDDPPNPNAPLNTQLWNFLGLLRLDRTAKPAYTAYQQLTSAGATLPRLGGHCYR